MVNITGELWRKPEFSEVKVLKKRLNEIKQSESDQGAAIDNRMPKTFKLAKKM